MTYKVNYFIVTDNGVQQLANSKMEKVYSEESILPEYAGKEVKVIEAIYEVENKKPVAIKRMLGLKFLIDEKGCLDSKHQISALKHTATKGEQPKAESISSTVIDASSVFTSKALNTKHEWHVDHQTVSLVTEKLGL